MSQNNKSANSCIEKYFEDLDACVDIQMLNSDICLDIIKTENAAYRILFNNVEGQEHLSIQQFTNRDYGKENCAWYEIDTIDEPETAKLVFIAIMKKRLGQ
jgi:hypothetical protein